MMKMMIKRTLLLLFFSFLSLIAFPQDKDFGVWYGVSADTKLTGKIKIELSTSVRTFEDASKIEEAFLQGGLKYKFNKYFSMAGSYRITENIEDDNSYYFRHKLFLDMNGSYSVGNFSFSGRVRLQELFKTYIEDENDKKPDSHGRVKLKTLYNIPSFPVNPYISAEIFCPVFNNPERTVDKERFTGGIEYKISKIHSFTLEYVFQRDYLPHLEDENIISVNYNINF